MKAINSRPVSRRALQALLCGAFLASSLALAVEPANWRLGPVYIAPTLEMETRYVDNVLRTEDDAYSSWILDTAP